MSLNRLSALENKELNGTIIVDSLGEQSELKKETDTPENNAPKVASSNTYPRLFNSRDVKPASIASPNEIKAFKTKLTIEIPEDEIFDDSDSTPSNYGPPSPVYYTTLPNIIHSHQDDHLFRHLCSP